MYLTISNIKYQDAQSSNATLIKYVIPKEGQTYEFVMQDDINKRTYNLSDRNSTGAYNLPVDKEKVYLNFVPQKTIVSDSNLKDYTDVEFSYFLAPVIIPPDPFALPEGQIFRCVGTDSLPLPKESYTYYIIEDGKKKLIPNYQTLEVMLANRGQTLLSVRIVPDKLCNEIPNSTGAIDDKSSSWDASMKDQTNPEVLKQMEDNVKSGAAIADAAAASAASQIAAVKAAEEKAKAEAEAAKAEAEAAGLAAQAAIAQAEAAKAQADAEKAKALQSQNNS
jgi:hypothetical protein